MPERRADNNPQENDFEQPVRQFVERRQKKDWVSILIPYLSGVGWVVAVVSLVLWDSAKPQKNNFLSIVLNDGHVRDYWNTQGVQTSFTLLLAVFGICLFGFIFNMLRHKRKTDRFNKSVIILGIVSVVSIILFLSQFGSML